MRTEEEIRTQIRKSCHFDIPDMLEPKDIFCKGYREGLFWILGE